MGAFDDLIPASSGGAFADLIPKKKASEGILDKASRYAGEAVDAIKERIDQIKDEPTVEPTADELNDAKTAAFGIYPAIKGKPKTAAFDPATIPPKVDMGSFAGLSNYLDDSVMKDSGAPQLGRVIPSASNPTFVDSIHSAWDAASPEERKALESRPGLVGRIAKERAGSSMAGQEIADQSPANEGLVDSPQQVDNNGSLNQQLGGGLPEDTGTLTPEQLAQGQRAGLAADRDRRRLQIDAMRKGLAEAPDGETPDGITGIVGNALARNYHTTNAIIGGLGAAAAKGVGADDLSLWFAKQYFDETAKAKSDKAAVGSFMDIKSLSDVPTYILEGVLENSSNLAMSIASGGLGAAFAKYGGTKAAASFVGEQVAKELAKRQAKGAAAGAAASAVGMEVGSIYPDVLNKTGQEATGTAAAFGTAAGLLDAIPAFRAAKNVFTPSEAVDLTMKALVKRYGVESVKQLGSEGWTEKLQQWIENGAVSYTDGSPLLTKENLIESIDAFFKGGMTGAVVGAGSLAYGDARNRAGIRDNNASIAATNAAEAAKQEAINKWKNWGAPTGAGVPVTVQPAQTENVSTAPGIEVRWNSPEAQQPDGAVSPGEAPTGGNAPTMTAQDVSAQAQQRLDALNRRYSGTEDRTVMGSDGKALKIRGEQPEIMTDAERRERDFLTANIGDPEKIATAYGVRIGDPQQSSTPPAGAENNVVAPSDIEARIAELEDKQRAQGLAQQEQDQLVDLLAEQEAQAQNQPAPAQPIPAAPQAAAVQPTAPVQPVAPAVANPDLAGAAPTAKKNWFSFLSQKGIAPASIKKGSAQWDALKAEFNGEPVKPQEPMTIMPITPVAPRTEPAAPVVGQDANLQNRDRERLASQNQMQDMVRNPDYGRLGPSRTPDSGAPMIFAVGDDHASIKPDQVGKSDQAVMSDGQRVPFRYAVVEAGTVQPSNFADGRVNPAFSSDAVGTLKALNNGRTAGIRGAYEAGNAGTYKQELIADSEAHGINPRVIEGMKNPMLIRLYSEQSNTQNMAAKSQAQGLGMSPSELARQDSALIDFEVISELKGNDIASAANRDFVRAFVGRLVADGQDVAGMMGADGTISPDGVRRIQAALMQRAFGDAELVQDMFESMDSDIKAIGEALKEVAGTWANMRDSASLGTINPDVDVTPNLMQAVHLIRQVRKQGTSIYDATVQNDIETGKPLDPLTVAVIRLFYSGTYMTRPVGKAKLAEELADYVTGAMETSSTPDMFGEQVTPADILAKITGQPGESNVNSSTQDSGQQPNGGSAIGVGTGQTRTEEPGTVASEGGAGTTEDRGRESGQNARSEQPAGELTLSGQTEADLAKANAEAEAEAAKAEATQRAEAEAKKKADEKAEIARRSEAAADSFQLGQSAEDNLTGQKDLLGGDSAPAETTESKYVPPEGTEHDDWKGSLIPGFKPSARQKALIDAVTKALDDGLSYTTDIDKRVAQELGYTGKTGDGTEFGMGVYLARKSVEAQHQHAADSIIRNALNLKAGDKLGTLIFNSDFKVTTNVEVASVSDDGRVVKIIGKRGAHSISATTDPTGIKYAMDRAKERGKRKDSFDEFAAARAPAEQSKQDEATTQSDAAAKEAIAQAEAIKPAEPDPAVESMRADQAKRADSQESRIADFGEKIGGARKDTARPLGPRYMSMPQDERPAWIRPYLAMQIQAGRFTRPEDVGKWQIMVEGDKRMKGAVTRVTNTKYDTKEEAEADIPLAVVAKKHRVYSYEKKRADGTIEKAFGIFRQVTDRKRALVKGGFATDKDAMLYMVKNPAEIIEHKFAFPERPWLDRIERKGVERRTGDVTTAMFEDTFGFRAGEFGNWNMGGDGQAALNHAYDALLDLADTIGVPPKALSLDGQLAIAFGARGTGGKNSAAAHYEPGAVVINLTKIKGAGSLAHEWWHAVEHYFARNSGKDGSDSVVTYGHGYKSEARPELIAAIKNVVDKMMYSEVSHTTEAEQVRKGAQKRIDNARESLEYRVRDLRARIATNPYGMGNKKVATAEQLAAWDAMVARLRDGDAGEEVYIENPSKMRNALGFKIGSVVRDMNALYKSITRHSFLRQDISSTGREIGRIAEKIADSMTKAEAKDAETVKVKAASEFRIEAKAIDNYRTGDYWSSPEEMGARAFESYVFDKMTGAGNQSDYLVNAVENKYYAALDMKPYPEGEERKVIDAAFDNLFKAIQTKETDKGVAMFSRADGNVNLSDSIVGESDGETRANVEQVVKAVVDRWATKPQVVVVTDMQSQDVPQAVRDYDAKQKSAGASGEPEAFFYKGTVYVVSSQLRTVDDAIRVTQHEGLGHFGLRGVFGDRLDGILDQLASATPELVKERAKAYGLKFENLDQRRQAAEEVLAKLSQTHPTMGYVKRAVAAIRTWLRENFSKFKDMHLTDDEIIRNWIIPAQNFVERGNASASDGGISFSRSVKTSVAANIDRGLASLEHALKDKTTVHRAMYRDGLGWVDFVWGATGKIKANNQTKGAMGIAHIIEARMRKDHLTRKQAEELLQEMVRVVASGTMADDGGRTNIEIKHGDYYVYLAKNPGSNAWAITAFEDNEVGVGASKAGLATHRPTQSAASLARDGLGANPLASDATSVATQRDITENGSTPGADSDNNLPQFSRSSQSILAADRARYLNIEARTRGYADIEALRSAEPAVADKLGEKWEKKAATPAEVTKRADAIIAQKVFTFRPLEAIAKTVSKLTGLEKVAGMVYDKAGSLLDQVTESTEFGRTLKAGLVSDYGIPEDVIDQRASLQGRQRVMLREAGGLINKLASLTREESRVVYEWMNEVDPKVIAERMSELPQDSIETLKEIQAMIDKMSQRAIELKLLTQKAYDAHKFAYLRRTYGKYVAEMTPGEKKNRQRAISILGDQFKGRGITLPATMKLIQNIAPDWWKRKTQEGKADTALIGEKFIRLEKRQHSGEGTMPMEGIGDRSPGKILQVAYYPAGEAIPVRYADWTKAGEFEVRDTKGDKLIMWRDFTKAEREQMGEVDEARFAIARTLHSMIHDVETAEYLAWIGENYGEIDADKVPGTIIDASERAGSVFKPGEWVQVPETKIAGTQVHKYGALAGKYIPGPIWNDVRQTLNGQFKPFGETYSKIISLWKTAKTALSPAVHMNNVMSNFFMADWHDVGAAHVNKALRIMLAAHDRQGKGVLGNVGNAAASMGIADREAAIAVLNRYRDSGGEIGSWATQELKREQLDPLLAALAEELGTTADGALDAQVGVWSALQYALHGRLPSAAKALAGSWGGKAVTNEAKSLMDLYQSEDEIFRVAAWLKAKEDGQNDIKAGEAARRSFLDYHINAPWINAMRNSAIPFISYTYRAVPMLLEVAGKKPHKLLKAMAVIGAINLLGTMLAGGDDDEDRKMLPDEKSGKVLGLVPKLVRMPWNDAHGAPVFLDIRRFIPLGDFFDIGQNHAAIPMLPSMMPGGPLELAGELFLNKSSFTGKEIIKATDTPIEQAQKVTDYLFKSFAPNLLGVPGTYATTAVEQAYSGRTDSFGRELSVAQAIAGSLGVKLGSYPPDVLRMNLSIKAKAEITEIEHTMWGLARQVQTNRMTQDEFQKQIEYQREKIRKIVTELREKVN